MHTVAICAAAPFSALLCVDGKESHCGYPTQVHAVGEQPVPFDPGFQEEEVQDE